MTTTVHIEGPRPIELYIVPQPAPHWIVGVTHRKEKS